MSEKGNQAVKTVSFMMLITLFGKILGMVREQLLAANYGTDMQAAAFLSDKKYPCEVQAMALPDKFIEQGTRECLLTNYGLCPEAIADRVRKFLARGEHNGGKKREA